MANYTSINSKLQHSPHGHTPHVLKWLRSEYVVRPQPFQNILTSTDITRFGKRLNLLTEIHSGTPVGLKKPFTLDFTLTISIGIAGLKFQKGGMPTIKHHNSRSVPQRTREGIASSQSNEDRNPPIINNHSEDRNAPITNSHGAAYNETQPIDTIA